MPDGAVPAPGSGCYVQAALADDDVNPDLQILEQQRQLKAQAREAKAARQLAKGFWAACTIYVCLMLYTRASTPIDVNVFQGIGKALAKAKAEAKAKVKGKGKGKKKGKKACSEAMCRASC